MKPLPVLDDDALGRLAPPTLVVVGGRDAMLDSADTVRRLRHAAPHVTVHVVPEAGHVVPGQTERVLDFLAARDAHPA
jgi:pimeloyl-ACP methyl ester carboxylesterase